MRILRQTTYLLTVIFTCFELVHAQEGHLKLRVTDGTNPVKGIRLIPADGPKMPSKPTKSNGETELYIPSYREGKSLTIALFQAPRNQILFPTSPPVPPSKCRIVMPISTETAEVVVVTRGQRSLLKSAWAVQIITSTIIENSLAKSFSSGIAAEPRLASLIELANLLDLDPKDIDQAIRSRLQETKDSYEKGLIALYTQNYKEAIRQLSNSLQAQEKSPRTSGKKRGMFVDTVLISNQTPTLKEREVRNEEVADAEQVNTTFFLGQSLYEQGKYSEAVDVFQKLSALRENNIQILNTYAMSLYRTRKYEQALQTLRRALDLAKDDHESQVLTLNNLGEICAVLSQYNLALELFNKSLTISRQSKDLKAQQIALRNIGTIYFKRADYSQALSSFNRSLTISRLLKDKLAEVADLTKIGNIYLDNIYVDDRKDLYKLQLNIWNAISTFEKALDISEQFNDKVSESAVLDGFASIFFMLGNYKEAENLYEDALKIRLEIFSKTHPDIIDSMFGLALSYTKQGKYDEAERSFKSLLEIEEKMFGTEHPEVAKAQRLLAIAYSRHGKYAEAEPLYKESLKIREKVFGPNTIEVATLLDSLAINYYRQGRYAEAELQIKRSIMITKKALGPYDLSVAYQLEMYADVLRKLNREAEALNMESQADAIRTRRIRRTKTKRRAAHAHINS